MPRRFPIQLKLTLGSLFPLLVAILVCWLTGFYLIGSRIGTQAQDKVRTDLNSAREVYLNELEHIRDVVKFTGRSPQAATALNRGDRKTLDTLLTPLLNNEQLDFLNVVNAYGQIVFRAGNPAETDASRWSSRLVPRLMSGEEVSGTMVIPYEELLKDNPRLAERVVIPVQATPRARQYTKKYERAGMFLVAAAPVKNAGGAVVGALYGGIMLNNNTGLVDKIKRIIYEGVQFDGKDAGSATIFLGDLRIATNVTAPGGKRAIGTLMSEQVYDRVLLEKRKWVGRAFVLDDWYFAAYEPIFDPDGKAVGSLYAGMSEKPYLKIQGQLNLIYAGVLFFGTLTGIALSWKMGSRLARPIRELENHARRVASGEREVQIAVMTRDEIGDLAEEFVQMTRALSQREEEIRNLNRDLERKVQERTAELEDKNLLLVRTREELVRAEKLAAIGELAAGVAHEINNPMAIIRGNAELLQMAIPEETPSREEVDTIVQQVGRVERIVANLLKFAHRERKHPGKSDINRLLDEILNQVGHQVSLTAISVQKRYAFDLPEIEGDADQLRQVFTNLILNAVQAMDGGGVLTVTTKNNSTDGDCEITIADTGAGITRENLEHIFNPFFTTRSSGTGLGLSVSYGIMKDHGGRIEVESEPGKGALFRVIIPLAQ
ncbi:MAG: integral membrane sensor signal transduction histidine [Geobacteraceae bacterium]|nr:MAG: integral membrane sensor signal transduction histidine [Geobacteraceae bacterium]